MATRQVKRTDIVGISSVSFIRTMTVSWSVVGTKPSARLYAFFDGVSVDQHVTPGGGVLGGVITSDANGNVSGTFKIPGATFNTGERKFRLQDSPTYIDEIVAGSTIGSATAIYTTNGIKQTLRDNITTITTIINQILEPRPRQEPRGGGRDPLAQSFFTYGVTGGCFISAIDLFFQSKDASIPVTVQIRELVNGLPSIILAQAHSSVTKNPVDVVTSTTALTATKFTFSHPVYLAEDRDWCFVIMANSNQYHVWTSKLGNVSKETGKKVFDQPFIGSLFKSENNITWTAEQDQDIKFTLYKAKFTPNTPAVLSFSADANEFLIYGDTMSVVSGSTTVTVTLPYQHGLRTNDFITIASASTQTLTVYRGIPISNLIGDKQVVVIDDYKLTFTSGTAATSTGTLATQGALNAVVIDAGGSGYSSPVLTFTGGGAGATQATATATLTSGAITGVTIISGGANYTAVPTLTVTDGGGGTGAVLVPICEAVFNITTNNAVHGVRPNMITSTVPFTEIKAQIKTTDSNYNVGALKDAAIGEISPLSTHSVFLSTKNQTQYLPGQKPTEVIVTLSTTNENVSPVIVTEEPPRVDTYAYVINNQTALETMTATAGSAGIASFTQVSVGSGYSGTATATISAPDIAGGTQATATCTMTGSDPTKTVTALVIGNAGSGYTKQPTVTISSSAGTTAVYTANLTPFNTELLATGGTAFSKYMTKPNTLATISKGARVFVNAMSLSQSSFDVYIRTSLSSAGSVHKNLTWKRMSCDVERNLSKSDTEYLDYAFYLDNIEPFDIYDLKIVMKSTNKAIAPRLADYRVIILAT